jgi:hypothetical protein
VRAANVKERRLARDGAHGVTRPTDLALALVLFGFAII